MSEKSVWTLCDPRNGGHPQVLDDPPVIKENNFILWGGELREINEIHRTKTGNQIELLR